MKIINNHELTHDSYYIDTEYVTNSMLNNLTGKSPEYFKHVMENPLPTTAAMKFGSALHMQVLQPEEYDKNYVVMPKFDKRTKKGKEDFEAFTNKHMFKTVLSQEDHDTIQEITSKLSKDKDAVQLLSNGLKEHIVVWHNEEYNVNCKGMLDVYNKQNNIIVDLKTTKDTSYYGFANSIKKFNYHKQAAFYMDAVKADEYYIVAVEKTKPYSISIVQLGEDLIDRGRELYNRDLEIYKYCLDNNYWPGRGFDYLDKKSKRTIHIMTEDIL